ncbi:MAG: hypothetical protein GQ574_17110 [Crocinitomix sp.]|nr:hypothetical protein [Crocinitomix sp.]
MFRDFLTNNSRSILIISILIGGWLLLYFLNSDNTEKLVNHPKVGGVYVFQEEELFAPMRIDSISDTHLYLRNYLYLFSDAVPKRNQILTDEFDLNFFAIYEKNEIRRLYDAGSLVKAYP